MANHLFSSTVEISNKDILGKRPYSRYVWNVNIALGIPQQRPRSIDNGCNAFWICPTSAKTMQVGQALAGHLTMCDEVAKGDSDGDGG